MRKETRELLQLFVGKARKLESSRFVKKMSDPSAGVTISGTTNGRSHTDRRLPDQEAIDAFVLTFRLFIQPNDRTSFDSLSKRVLPDPDVSIEWKQEFTKVRDELDQYLDAQAEIHLIRDGSSPTRREVMDLIIYGDLAHSDKAKSRELAAWKNESWMFPLLEAEFSSILMRVRRAIDRIADLSEREVDANP